MYKIINTQVEQVTDLHEENRIHIKLYCLEGLNLDRESYKIT